MNIVQLGHMNQRELLEYIRSEHKKSSTITQHPFSDTVMQELVFIGYFGKLNKFKVRNMLCITLNSIINLSTIKTGLA